MSYSEKVVQVQTFGLKFGIRAEKGEFRGTGTPKRYLIGTSPSKGTFLSKTASFESLYVQIGLADVWSHGSFEKGGDSSYVWKSDMSAYFTYLGNLAQPINPIHLWHIRRSNM